MNVGELRANFKDALNRDDCTDTKADLFISMALLRLERTLRAKFQKHLWKTQIAPGYPGHHSIPTDYLSMDFIKVNDIPASRIASNYGDSGEKEPGHSDSRRYWYTENERIYFLPGLSVGDKVKINYYKEMPEATEDGSTVTYTEIIPDVLMYGALIHAAIHFMDERREEFTEFYNTLLGEVQLQADMDDLSGGAIITNHEGYL